MVMYTYYSRVNKEKELNKMGKENIIKFLLDTAEEQATEMQEIRKELPEYAAFLRGMIAAKRHAADMIKKYL